MKKVLMFGILLSLFLVSSLVLSLEDNSTEDAGLVSEETNSSPGDLDEEITIAEEQEYRDRIAQELRERQELREQIRENISQEVGQLEELRKQLREQYVQNVQERVELRQEIKEDIKELLEARQEIRLENKELILRKINDEIMELESNLSRVRTRLELNNEGNISELKARLSNGRNALVKVMPETASERALERLRLKNCNETRNCTIELKEVGKGNETRLAYEAVAEKRFRVFGIFKNKERIMTQIDAETGEVISTKRPWWSWLASEEKEALPIEEESSEE